MKRLLSSWRLLVTTVAAQTPQRRDDEHRGAARAIRASIHLHPVVVVGKLELRDNRRAAAGRRQPDRSASCSRASDPDELAEVRGEFWDLGRMNADDPRLASFDLQTTFQVDPEGAWPTARPGDGGSWPARSRRRRRRSRRRSATWCCTRPASSNQKVTITGQFAGRNLLGDLPDAPARSRYDFVVRSADAAIWVINLRPRGKRLRAGARRAHRHRPLGRGRAASSQQGRGLHAARRDGRQHPADEAPGRDDRRRADPRAGGAAARGRVQRADRRTKPTCRSRTNVRIQFSRDINPATFKGRIAVRYGPTPAGVAETVAPPLEFTTQYLPAPACWRSSSSSRSSHSAPCRSISWTASSGPISRPSGPGR